MDDLPARGDAVRELPLALPPHPLARSRARRPLKRWRYVGIYTPELMLCVGEARIGPLPQRWWAVAFPDGRLRERTTIGRGGVRIEGSRVLVEARDVRIELELSEGPGVETVSPVGQGDAYIWTRKQACVPVRGTIALAGAEQAVAGPVGFIDDSAGYHARHTAWKWSAGVGLTEDGARVGWNLVTGIHDAPSASERSLWVDGTVRELGPVAFADDLSRISFAEGGELAFDEWATREENTNALLVRSRYRQPFGTFTGELPGGLRLAEGCGVMEDHEVWW